MMDPQEKKEPSFEEDLERLENTVRQLETGKHGLDESLARFEEGVALTRRLRGKLGEAKHRVEELLETGEKRDLDVP